MDAKRLVRARSGMSADGHQSAKDGVVRDGAGFVVVGGGGFGSGGRSGSGRSGALPPAPAPLPPPPPPPPPPRPYVSVMLGHSEFFVDSRYQVRA